MGQLPATDSSQKDTDNECDSVISAEKRYASVVIEDTVVHAFIDTGADIPVISEDFRMTTPALHKKPIVKQFIPLTGVTGDPLDSVGYISVNLSIAHKTMTHTASSQKLYYFRLGFPDGQWHYCEHSQHDVDAKEVPLVSPRHYVPCLTAVSVSSTVTIPAMSERVITASLDAPLKGLLPNGYTGVFEPHYTDQSFASFAWTVARVERGFVCVKVANSSCGFT